MPRARGTVFSHVGAEQEPSRAMGCHLEPPLSQQRCSRRLHPDEAYRHIGQRRYVGGQPRVHKLRRRSDVVASARPRGVGQATQAWTRWRCCIQPERVDAQVSKSCWHDSQRHTVPSSGHHMPVQRQHHQPCSAGRRTSHSVLACCPQPGCLARTAPVVTVVGKRSISNCSRKSDRKHLKTNDLDQPTAVLAESKRAE